MIHPRTPYAVLKQTCLVLVLTISTLAPVYAQGEAHRRGTRQPHSTPRQSVPSYPAPLTQNLPELPAGFTQEVPGSVAELAEMENWVRNVVDQIRPTVVGIETQDGGLGSGVIISADGYVLTVAHVIRESNQKVTITLADGRELRGTTLGVIERTDAGILKIDNVRDLPFARIAPAETMTSGNWCLAMGHPGGFTSGREPVIRLGRVVAA